MKLSGRKVIFLSSTFALLLLTKQSAFAIVETSIETSSEGNGSSNVSVKNNTTSSNNTITTTSNGRTDIVIECNGVKKEYHSDKAENVTLNCNDDITGTVKSEVKISGTRTSPTINPTEKPAISNVKDKVYDDKEDMKKEVKSARDQIKNEQEDFMKKLQEIFHNLFKKFHL